MISQSSQLADAMQALRSPLRIELFMVLEAIGASSVAELAVAMDRRADGLYHHVHKLERVGLIRVVGYRSTGGHDEALYDRTDLGGRLRPGVGEAEAFTRMAHALSKHGVDALGRSISVGGFREGHRFRAETAWLTPEEQEAVSTHYEEVLRIFESARTRGRHGERTVAIMLMSPDEPKGRRSVKPKREDDDETQTAPTAQK